MKVLLLAWNYPPAKGGIEYVAQHLVAGMTATGDTVWVIARHDGRERTESEVLRPARRGLVRYLAFALWQGWRLLRGHRFDLIACPGLVTAPVAWLLARRFRKPFVVLAHGSDVLYGGWAYQRVMRFLFLAADGVAANSGYTRDRLLAIGCQPSRVSVIHPGVATDLFPVLSDSERLAIRHRYGLEGRRVLISVGRLVRRKGYAEFVEKVLPRLIAGTPDLLYVIVGGESTESLVHRELMGDRIRASVSRLGLTDHVRLAGAINDETLRDYYYGSDIFVMPTLDIPGDVEGFGIVFLEAALAEVPAVGIALGGVPDAVVDGVTGLLAAPGDWDGLADRTMSILADPGRCQRLGAAARERALAQFAWPVIVGQYQALMQTVAKRHAAES